MDSPRARPSLADDPAFLDTLARLDRDLAASSPSKPAIPPRSGSAQEPRPAPAEPQRRLTIPRRGSRPRVPLPLTMASPFESLMGTDPPPPNATARSLGDLFPANPARRRDASAPPRVTDISRAATTPAGPSSIVAEATKYQSPPYEAFYGLQEAPFTLSTDPKFLYHSTPHNRVAQQLLTAIRNREGVVVLTGEIGSGKTTLCRAVIEQLDHRTLTSLVTDPFVSGEELLMTILVDFGVMSREELARGPFTTRHDLSATLKSFIESLAPLQATAVVMIDEAQNLPPDVMDQVRILSEAGGALGLLQIVLVGQPSLSDLLNRPEHRSITQRVSVRSVLSPLPADEISDYVQHRLSVVSSSPRVQFDASALAYLYQLSRGVPRVLNLLADRALARGYEASASLITVELIEAAAEDLDIGMPQSAMQGALVFAGFAISLVLLVLLGAGAAAWVFHDAFTRGIARWELAPRPPAQAVPPP